MIPVWWWWWCSFIFFFNTPRTKEVFSSSSVHVGAAGATHKPVVVHLFFFFFFGSFFSSPFLSFSICDLCTHFLLHHKKKKKKGFDFTTISYSCPLFLKTQIKKMKEKRDEMFVKREFTADWIDQHLLLLGVLASSSVFVLPVWEE
jgi:hypothetical protein